MCKACYARVTTAELSGPGYTRVESELLSDLIEKITTRQITYLLKEHLPVLMVIMIKIQDPQNPHKHKYVKRYSTQIPVRYLMPKLHKAIPAFRSITACCGTTTEGVAKTVNAALVGIRPVLDALWRARMYLYRFGFKQVLDYVWWGWDSRCYERLGHKAAMAKNGLPHHLETFDFVAMYTNIPVKCLKRIMWASFWTWYSRTKKQKTVPNRYTFSMGSKMMKRNQRSTKYTGLSTLV